MNKENASYRFLFLFWILSGLLILFLSARLAWCSDLVLLWDANTEPDIEGYGIYFKNTPDSEYSLWGYLSIQELADQSNPRFVASGLEKGKTYYFASTAYNWYGLESTFSNSLCIEVGETISACPSSGGGSGGSSDGGGGGGGGCFIDSLMNREKFW